jgi:hypothetical protein
LKYDPRGSKIRGNSGFPVKARENGWIVKEEQTEVKQVLETSKTALSAAFCQLKKL